MYREGRLYTQGVMEVFDHDFLHLADGIAIPHGLYDLILNTGYITIGTSHDTSEFSCDCIFDWWRSYGKDNYPNANSILLLCDSGGSNNALHYIFKENLQKLADRINIEIRVAHYPPYSSKYNPIEHRLFPHVSRSCQGVIFKSTEMVKNFMQNTTTRKGLKVFVSINDKIYEPGDRASEEFRENMKIVFDDYLPKWNYTAVPSMTARTSPFYDFTAIRDKMEETRVTLKRTLQMVKQDFSDMY